MEKYHFSFLYEYLYFLEIALQTSEREFENIDRAHTVYSIFVLVLVVRGFPYPAEVPIQLTDGHNMGQSFRLIKFFLVVQSELVKGLLIIPILRAGLLNFPQPTKTHSGFYKNKP